MVADTYVFEEFPWQVEAPDVRRKRLCTGGRWDPINIDCVLEGASFAPDYPEPRDEVIVMAYNLERGLAGAEQVRTLLGDSSIPLPDVVLASEVDRGCTRTDYRNVARDWAEALGMSYVYGVEFVELPRWWGPAGGRMHGRCEHGNAIFSRYPLGNVRLVRHEKSLSWHSWWQRLFRVGEPRLGGRMALAADVKVGERYLHVYSVHFESREGDEYRAAQAAELALLGTEQPFGVIIGGDMNCSRYIEDLRSGSMEDPVTQAVLSRGYHDAHAALELESRHTSRSGKIIDLLLGRGVAFAEAGIGNVALWGTLSDHLPVWSRVRLG